MKLEASKHIKQFLMFLADVDLVHISIPSKFVPQAVEDCGKKGVKFIIINSAGFKEVGAEGEAARKRSCFYS